LIRPFEILDSAGDVTFPDDYPNSVKHVLLIGTVGFFISAVVFLYLSMTRKKASVAHSLTFLSTAVAAMAYYCMWNGLGVEYKTSDITPRVIFWARHFDQILTLPVCTSQFDCSEKSKLFLPFLAKERSRRLFLEIYASSQDQTALSLWVWLARVSSSPWLPPSERRLWLLLSICGGSPVLPSVSSSSSLCCSASRREASRLLFCLSMRIQVNNLHFVIVGAQEPDFPDRCRRGHLWRPLAAGIRGNCGTWSLTRGLHLPCIPKCFAHRIIEQP
jgi:hypothetical protein